MNRPIYECIAYDLGNELEDLKQYKKDLDKYTDFIEKQQAEQLNLYGVSKRLNENTLEEINTIMWESYMVISRTFDREQGTMIMKELEKWAKR